MIINRVTIIFNANVDVDVATESARHALSLTVLFGLSAVEHGGTIFYQIIRCKTVKLLDFYQLLVKRICHVMLRYVNSPLISVLCHSLTHSRPGRVQFDYVENHKMHLSRPRRIVSSEHSNSHALHSRRRLTTRSAQEKNISAVMHVNQAHTLMTCTDYTYFLFIQSRNI